MSIVLKEKTDKYLVVDLDNGISFIHDNDSGENYFNQKTMAEALGTSIGNVSNRIKRLLTVTHDLKGEKAFYTNRIISLNVGGSDRPVRFYPFAVFNHLAHRINTKQALLILDYVQQACNEKFNKDNNLPSKSTNLIDNPEIINLIGDAVNKKRNAVEGLSKEKPILYGLDKETGDKCHSRIMALSYEADELEDAVIKLEKAKKLQLEASEKLDKVFKFLPQRVQDGLLPKDVQDTFDKYI